MKKRLAILAAAVAFVLAIPAVALAAEYSPVAKSATDTSSDIPTTLNVKADVPSGTTGVLVVEVTQVTAKGTVVGESDEVAGKFVVYVEGDLEESDVQNLLLTLNCGSEYAGHAVKVYAHHTTDGACAMFEGVLSSTGSFQFNDTKLGEYTVVVGEKVGGGNGGDDNPTSPATGHSATMALVALGTIVCIAGAFCVARSIRKDNE